MTSIFSKVRTVTLGTLHDVLDAAIDMNSPSALRQYVRDLESALDSMQNIAAMQAGTVRTLTREIGDLQHKIESETTLVTKILAGNDPNKDTLSRTKGAAIVGWKNELATKTTALESQTKTSHEIDNAVDKLNAKHALMVTRVRDLERIDQETKAKEHAAASLQQAGKIVANGVDISMDDIQSKMMARNDVASEKFDRAMGAVQVGEDAETSAAVDEFLANLQQHSDTAQGK